MTSGSRSRKANPLGMIAAATDAVAECLAQYDERSAPAQFVNAVAAEIHQATARNYSTGEIQQMVAQALVQARIFWTGADASLQAAAKQPNFFPERSSTIAHLLRLATSDDSDRDSTSDWNNVRALLRDVASVRASSAAEDDKGSQASSSYDDWLSAFQPRWRSKYGIYFTPRSIARFVVRSVDSLLRTDFGLHDGLADVTTWHEIGDSTSGPALPEFVRPETPLVAILDPAAGDGIFLEEVIESIYQTLQCKWIAESLTTSERQAAWNQYVPEFLLPRLNGFELLLPQLVLAWLRLYEKLARTGYEFGQPANFNLALCDTLSGADQMCGRRNFTVLVGNPPFAALAHETSAWMTSLLKRTRAGKSTLTSYYEVDGEPLRERKLWLHDDYVKFLRYAQWQIECSGCGIVGFVTNHSYLNNLTFRGMRQSLTQSFPRISVVDLHGNRKNGEAPPAGMRDENVFGIDQGIAIGLFEKPLRDVPARIEFREVWGSRASKLNVLASTDESLPAPRIVVAKTPHSFFVPQAASVLRENELENGFSLDAIMPTHSSAAVTARDGFVVGFSQQELRERLQAFSNLTISDDEIRRQYFHRTRSARYVRGDTRGWKMPAARVTASKTDDVDGLLQTVQYRPFDRRVIVWADWLIDWPRSDMMRPMLQADNIALVTRRQMLPGQACNFFFVTDTIVLDGLLRSDNRGNETFFPLYSFVAPTSDGRQFAKQHNFSIPFVERCAKQWRIAWLPTGAGDLALTFGPADLFALIYAQFFSSGYRERYAELLRNAFPRVFLPLDLGLLRSLCMLGNELIQTHLLRGTDPANLRYEVSQLLCEQLATGDLRIAGTYPRHDSASSRIELSAECYLSGISEEIWQYRFGAHQVCRKWLRDRKGRVLDKSDITTYCTIVHAVEQTLQCTAAIDQAIEASGGWPDAFAW